MLSFSRWSFRNVIQPLKWTFFRRDKPVIQTFYLVFFSSTESSTDARKVKITAMEPHTRASGCGKAKIALSLNVIRGTIILIKVASNTCWSHDGPTHPTHRQLNRAKVNRNLILRRRTRGKINSWLFWVLAWCMVYHWLKLFIR